MAHIANRICLVASSPSPEIIERVACDHTTMWGRVLEILGAPVLTASKNWSTAAWNRTPRGRCTWPPRVISSRILVCKTFLAYGSTSLEGVLNKLTKTSIRPVRPIGHLATRNRKIGTQDPCIRTDMDRTTSRMSLPRAVVDRKVPASDFRV
jgi:hypothetical protein